MQVFLSFGLFSLFCFPAIGSLGTVLQLCSLVVYSFLAMMPAMLQRSVQARGGQPPPLAAGLGVLPCTPRDQPPSLQCNGGVTPAPQDLTGGSAGVADGLGLVDQPFHTVGDRSVSPSVVSPVPPSTSSVPVAVRQSSTPLAADSSSTVLVMDPTTSSHVFFTFGTATSNSTLPCQKSRCQVVLK